VNSAEPQEPFLRQGEEQSSPTRGDLNPPVSAATRRRRMREPSDESRGPRHILILTLLIFVTCSAPLMIGGGPIWAQLISVGLSLLLGVLFITTRAHSLRFVPFAGVGLLAVLMTILQLIPIPRGVLDALSPQAATIRAAASTSDQLASLLPITLDVPATIIELSKALAYLALFLITVAVARRPAGARPLLLALALLGGTVAAVAMAHRAVDAKRLFGLYMPLGHPGLGFFPPFINGNQAAALLVLSALVALGLSLQSQGTIRWLSISSLSASLIVLPMTGARAGFIGLATGAVGLASRLLARRFGWFRALLIASFLVAVVAIPTLMASQVLRSRLSGGATSMLHNQKTRGWQDAVELISDYRFVGVGRGAFEAPVTRYRKTSEGIRLAFPEMLPLQLASEWGLPLTIVLAALCLWGFVRLSRSLFHLETSVQAAAFGVIAVLTQECANFSIELTGVAIPTVVAFGIVVGRTQERLDPSRKRDRKLTNYIVIPVVCLWIAAFGASLWAYPRTLWLEGDRLREQMARGADVRTTLKAAAARHPADAYLALLAHIDASSDLPLQAETQLQRALSLFPADGTLHLFSARWLTKNGRSAQAALEYKAAAERGTNIDRLELYQSLGPHLIAEAVPQTEESLMNLARFLLAQKQNTPAEMVSAKAVEVATDVEQAALERLSLARQAATTEFLELAAEDLVAIAKNPSSFVLAAEAYATAGDGAASYGAILKGLQRIPKNGALVVKGARLLLDRGEQNQATAFLREHADGRFSLSEQLQIEQIKALIADRQGDLVGAVSARARARLLSESSNLRPRR
jgi:hypothetical protein